jgi:hypothetical protein
LRQPNQDLLAGISSCSSVFTYIDVPINFDNKLSFNIIIPGTFMFHWSREEKLGSEQKRRGTINPKRESSLKVASITAATTTLTPTEPLASALEQHREQSSRRSVAKGRTAPLDEIAKKRGLAHAIYLKYDPLTGKKDVFSRCSKCGMLGSCKILEEQPIKIKGTPFRLGIARCFWMEHNFRILLSE